MIPNDIAEKLLGEKPAGSDAANRGRKLLDELRPAIDAKEKEPLIRAFAELADDRRKVDDLATFARLDRGGWRAWLMLAGTVRGLGPMVRMFRGTVEERSSEQAAAIEGGQRSHLRVADDDEGYQAPACVPDGWRAPVGWRVTQAGVWRETEEGADRIATRPVWVVGYLEDVDGHGFSVRLAWRQVSGRIDQRVVSAKTFADTRALVALSRHGLPVLTGNSRALSFYIDAAIEANAGRLPLERVAGRFGWLPGGGFLLGGEYLGSEDNRTSLAPDAGLEQLANAYRSRGTWAGWLEEVVRPARRSPMFWLAVYNAVASVLIEPFDLGDNWAIDRSGETSKGKSTVGRAAFSVWGNPSMRPSWKTTRVGVEAVASMLRNLPLSLDDSKKARSSQDVAAVVYMHSGGLGSFRGKPGDDSKGVGLRVTERWRSSLDSDGEQALTSFTADAGARARVLCMRGDPLPDGDTATEVGLGCVAHYGHLGRRVIEFLNRPGSFEAVQVQWDNLSTRWAGELRSAGAVPRRLSRIVAALHLSQWIAQEVGLPEPECDPMAYARQCAAAGGADADQPAEALRAVYDLAASKPTSFWGRHETSRDDGTPRVPLQGWLGVWNSGDAWEHLDVRTTVVRKLLQASGYDVGVVDRWFERGWLEIHTGAGRRARVRLDGSVVNVYRFKRRAIEDVLA